MTRKKIILMTILSVLLLGITAKAADPVTLEEALIAADSNSLAVKEAEAGRFFSRADLESFQEGQAAKWSISVIGPSVDEDGSNYSPAWHLRAKDVGPLEYSMGISQSGLSVTMARTLWPDPLNGIELQERTLDLSALKAQETLSDQKEAAQIETYSAFRSLQLAVIGTRLAQEEAALAKETLEAEERLVQIGESTPERVKSAQAKWLRLTGQASKEAATATAGQEAFLTGLGLSVNRPLAQVNLDSLLAKAKKAAESNLAQNPPQWKQIYETDSHIQTLTRDLELKKQALAVAQGDSPVSVEISGAADTSFDGLGSNWSIGLGAAWDLSGGKARRRQLAEAQLRLELAQGRLAQAQSALRQRYNEAVANQAYLHWALRAAHLDWENARASLEIASSQKAAGVRTERELRQAKLAENRAELALVQAFLDYRAQTLKVLVMQGEEPVLEGEAWDA